MKHNFSENVRCPLKNSNMDPCETFEDVSIKTKSEFDSELPKSEEFSVRSSQWSHHESTVHNAGNEITVRCDHFFFSLNSDFF